MIAVIVRDIAVYLAFTTSVTGFLVLERPYRRSKVHKSSNRVSGNIWSWYKCFVLQQRVLLFDMITTPWSQCRYIFLLIEQSVLEEFIDTVL